MPLPTWEEIEAAPLDILNQLFWQPIPARTEDERKRVRRMAERMAQLEPKPTPRDYLPAPEKPAPKPKPDPPPCPPKPSSPKQPAADMSLFRDMFRKP